MRDLMFYFFTVVVIMFFLEAMTSPRAASSGITAPRVPRGSSRSLSVIGFPDHRLYVV